jgi:hypothetical protein
MIMVSTSWDINVDDFYGVKDSFGVIRFGTSDLGCILELQDLGVDAWVSVFKVSRSRWSKVDFVAGDMISSLDIRSGVRCYRTFRHGKVLSCMDFAKVKMLEMERWLGTISYDIWRFWCLGGDDGDHHDSE